MDWCNLRPLDSKHYRRKEALRRLVERYELGELSDEDFTERKQQILRDGAIPEDIGSAQIDLIVATYDDVAVIDPVLNSLRTPREPQWPWIIDIALLRSHGSGAIRIGVIPKMTRPLATGSISIISGICGLLFPLSSLVPQHAGTPVAMSFGSFAPPDDELSDLRSIGSRLANGTTSIVVVCWTVVADTITAAFGDADHVTCRTFGNTVASNISAVLAAGADAPGPCWEAGDR